MNSYQVLHYGGLECTRFCSSVLQWVWGLWGLGFPFFVPLDAILQPELCFGVVAEELLHMHILFCLAQKKNMLSEDHGIW